MELLFELDARVVDCELITPSSRKENSKSAPRKRTPQSSVCTHRQSLHRKAVRFVEDHELPYTGCVLCLFRHCRSTWCTPHHHRWSVPHLDHCARVGISHGAPRKRLLNAPWASTFGYDCTCTLTSEHLLHVSRGRSCQPKIMFFNLSTGQRARTCDSTQKSTGK